MKLPHKILGFPITLGCFNPFNSVKEKLLKYKKLKIESCYLFTMLYLTLLELHKQVSLD